MKLGPGIARTKLPQGFFVSGINSGVRKYRPDLGVITSDYPMTAAGVFTQNEAKAACVHWSKGLLPSNDIKVVITNSGQANAATGAEGVFNNKQMAKSCAEVFECDAQQVLTASTGMIGVQLSIDLITKAMPELRARLTDSAEPFANAILTTDLVPKTVSTAIKLSQGEVVLTGIAKGSGMIHPNMATMLGYLMSDVKLNIYEAQTYLKNAVDESFNMISVDGDTSTNDSAFLLCNGASGVELVTDEDKTIFSQTLIEVCQLLAKAIARDGEGATKLIEIKLTGAADKKLAKQAARGLTMSPLIKSAVHGEDSNWGRILARLGAEGVPAEDLSKMILKMQGEIIFENGAPAAFDRDKLRSLLRSDTVFVDIELPHPDKNIDVMAWGCDLSKKYVEINAEYST